MLLVGKVRCVIIIIHMIVVSLIIELALVLAWALTDSECGCGIVHRRT